LTSTPHVVLIYRRRGGSGGYTTIYSTSRPSFHDTTCGAPALKASLTAPPANKFLTSRAHQGIYFLNYTLTDGILILCLLFINSCGDMYFKLE